MLKTILKYLYGSDSNSQRLNTEELWHLLEERKSLDRSETCRMFSILLLFLFDAKLSFDARTIVIIQTIPMLYSTFGEDAREVRKIFNSITSGMKLKPYWRSLPYPTIVTQIISAFWKHGYNPFEYIATYLRFVDQFFTEEDVVQAIQQAENELSIEDDTLVNEYQNAKKKHK